MNKNGDPATMYRTIPAVAGLNKVEGFDPSSLLGRTVSPTTGEEGLQLGLAYKKLWFRLAYPEGRLQTEKVSLTEQMAVFEARVYLHYSDADPVSSFASGCAREDASGGRYIQAAQDQAMDAALTDAGFGLQFADVCTDGRMAGDGEKSVHPEARDAATEKSPARNAGSAGAVVSAGNAVHAGSVVRPFPGASADPGTKKAPAQGAQPFGARQPVQTAAMPQGQEAPAGTGQPARTAAMPQNQGRPLNGNGQPVQAAAMPQNQGRQPAGARQPAQAAMPQGQKAQPAAVAQGTGLPVAGTGKPIQAVVPQGQGTHLAGDRQGVPPVLPQKRETPPDGIGQPAQTVRQRDQGMLATGNKLPVPPTMPQKQGRPADGTGMPAQTVMPNNQGAPPAGNKLPVSPTMPQKQEPQPDGAGLPVQAVVPKDQGAQPAGKKQPVTPAMPQGQGVQHGSKENTAQLAAPAAPVSATSRKAAAGGSRSGEAVKGSTASGGRAAAPNTDTEQGKAASSAGAVDTAHPAKGQRYFGNTKAVASGQQNQPPHQYVAAQPAAPQEQPSQLLVPPASPENKGAVQSTADAASSSTDSLPMGKGGQTNAEQAAAADALPVPAGSPGKEESRSSVLEAIALLNGQALPTGTAESPAGESKGSSAGTVTENRAAASMEAVSPEGGLPVNGETAQGEPVPRYTPDMSVEEIVSLMTLEEAGKVVVDTGVSKGQTIAEVAQRRPPSLKFYRYGGYKGPNNILRAAAQVMLDSMEGQKAS